MVEQSEPLRRLGDLLKGLRKGANLKQADVAQLLGCTQVLVGQWELGNRRISEKHLSGLLRVLDASREVRQQAESLREKSTQENEEWTAYNLPSPMRPLVDLESEAIRRDTFEPVLVPGLLQTEAYAYAVHYTQRKRFTEDEIRQTVAARMKRQRRLYGEDPLNLRVILPESVIHLRIGSDETFRGQLKHLLGVSKMNNVTIRILEFDRNGYTGIPGDITVLHFANPKINPPVGFFTSPLKGYMVTDSADTALMADMFEDALSIALSEAESRELINAKLESGFGWP